MALLIKNAKIVSPGSTLHKKKRDILIKNGVIEKISSRITDASAKIVESPNLCVSPGWCDIGPQGGEPGFEYRESFKTLSNSAASGGYTALALFPNTNPVIDDKSSVQFIQNNTENETVDFYPIGAISKNCKGEEITEMIDMHRNGAIAFSDGDKTVSSSGLLLRALMYVKAFNGLIIHHPDDTSLSNKNNIHEGSVSTSLGLKASPSLAESLTLTRDLEMTQYTESRILCHLLSAGISLSKLQLLDNKGIFSSVSYMNLCFTDEMLSNFDVNYKVNPPLRSRRDMQALIKGVTSGSIDIICSNHVPLEDEKKKLEFVYAQNGAIGLQTCFSALNTMAKRIRLDRLINCIAINPRKILGLDIEIKEKVKANLTLFDPSASWTFTEEINNSKSKNSPFFGQDFTGKVVGVINGKKSYFNNY